MSAAAPYWEIVRTTAGFHARFRARNGRTIVRTEVYKKHDGALKAIRIVQFETRGTFIRDVDERP